MKSILICIACFFMSTAHLVAQENTPNWQLIWKIEDLPNPESVIYDSARDLLFVSNQHYNEAEGSASISTLNLDGTIADKTWLTGLNRPKGMVIVGNSLFVSDVTELIEIDLETASIVQRYQDDNASFLNDVAADTDGNIYVSDTVNSSIYKLDRTGDFSVWLESSKLESPNGLLVVGEYLYVASWGKFRANAIEATRGGIVKVSMADKTIEKLLPGTLGNLDGLQTFEDSDFLISDWPTGNIMKFSQKDGNSLVIKTERGAADIAYLEEQGILLVPIAVSGQVQAYSVTK